MTIVFGNLEVMGDVGQSDLEDWQRSMPEQERDKKSRKLLRRFTIKGQREMVV